MKTLLIILALGLNACGADEGGHATSYLPVCCAGRVAASHESLLMCKANASNEVSSVLVKRSETGMISTMEEMKYLSCQ